MAKKKDTAAVWTPVEVGVLNETVIEHYTDAELNLVLAELEKKNAEHLRPYRDEIKRREKEAMRRVIKARDDFAEKIEQNVEFLLELFLEHAAFCKGKDSCHVDPCDDHSNGCGRCFLLEVKSGRWMDREFRLDLRGVRDPLPEPKD